MHYYWGMYFYWWFFWIFIWIVFFSFMTPMRRATYRGMQSPMQVLQRRYAAGEDVYKRQVPAHAGALVPLEASQILWQR